MIPMPPVHDDCGLGIQGQAKSCSSTLNPKPYNRVSSNRIHPERGGKMPAMQLSVFARAFDRVLAWASEATEGMLVVEG